MSKQESFDFWDTHPCTPELSINAYAKQFHRELEFITRNLHKYSSAIDVGCGTGQLPILYQQRDVQRVVGLDQSAKSLALARARGNYGIEWVQGDAEAMEFSDNEFDFGSAIGVFHHTPDTVRAILELERVCKHEVVVMLYDFDLRSYLKEKIWHQYIQGSTHRDFDAPILKRYSHHAIHKLFSNGKHGQVLKKVRALQSWRIRGWAWYVRLTLV